MTAFFSQRFSPWKIKSLFFKLFILLVFLVFSVLIMIYIGIQESKEIEINQYVVEADIENPMRIVHITDLHNAQFGDGNKDLVSAINSLHPDLICMTGDMINRDEQNLTIICNLIDQLNTIAPVYYGYGNHETVWEENFNRNLLKELSSHGATVVQDTYVDLMIRNNKIRIGGCMNYYRKWGMMEHSPEGREKEEAFANSFENTNYFKILLNHIPTSFVDWNGKDKYNVDLVFTGHYHGGVVRLPLINLGLYAPYIGFFPKYTKGVVYGTNAICIQSAGLGEEHAIPRIYNPPEIVAVNLIPSEK